MLLFVCICVCLGDLRYGYQHITVRTHHVPVGVVTLHPLDGGITPDLRAAGGQL